MPRYFWVFGGGNLDAVGAGFWVDVGEAVCFWGEFGGGGVVGRGFLDGGGVEFWDVGEVLLGGLVDVVGGGVSLLHILLIDVS